MSALSRQKFRHLERTCVLNRRQNRRRAYLLRLLMVPTVVLVGCGGHDLSHPYDDAANLIHAYCSYGAETRSQLDGCERHVEAAYIRQLETRAARYARGEITGCHDEAGPYCEGPRVDDPNPYRYSSGEDWMYGG